MWLVESFACHGSDELSKMNFSAGYTIQRAGFQREKSRKNVIFESFQLKFSMRSSTTEKESEIPSIPSWPPTSLLLHELTISKIEDASIWIMSSTCTLQLVLSVSPQEIMERRRHSWLAQDFLKRYMVLFCESFFFWQCVD